MNLNIAELSWVCVFTVDQGLYRAQVDQWDMIDAAFSNWIERRIDKVLCITCLDGADTRVPTSRIGELLLSTPENRANSRELDKSAKLEAGFINE